MIATPQPLPDPNAPILVTYDTAPQARSAGEALLADQRVDEPIRVAVHDDAAQLDTVPLRLTRARAYAILGGAAVGSALAALGAIASATGALRLSAWTAALLGLVVGALYGSTFGGIAGSTELRPRIARLRRLLRQGRAAVRVEVPPRQAALAQHVLLRQGGARRAL